MIAMGVKTLTFSSQYIERIISIFNETLNQMNEQKNISDSLKKVAKPFNNGLNTTF